MEPYEMGTHRYQEWPAPRPPHEASDRGRVVWGLSRVAFGLFLIGAGIAGQGTTGFDPTFFILGALVLLPVARSLITTFLPAAQRYAFVSYAIWFGVFSWLGSLLGVYGHEGIWWYIVRSLVFAALTVLFDASWAAWKRRHRVTG